MSRVGGHHGISSGRSSAGGHCRDFPVLMGSLWDLPNPGGHCGISPVLGVTVGSPQCWGSPGWVTQVPGPAALLSSGCNLWSFLALVSPRALALIQQWFRQCFHQEIAAGEGSPAAAFCSCHFVTSALHDNVKQRERRGQQLPAPYGIQVYPDSVPSSLCLFHPNYPILVLPQASPQNCPGKPNPQLLLCVCSSLPTQPCCICVLSHGWGCSFPGSAQTLPARNLPSPASPPAFPPCSVCVCG